MYEPKVAVSEFIKPKEDTTNMLEFVEQSTKFTRPGPTPAWIDNELMTLAIVGQCCVWDVETELLSQWHERRDLFPHVPLN